MSIALQHVSCELHTTHIYTRSPDDTLACRLRICPHACMACIVVLQVCAELGYPYEDQEYLLEPDMGMWMDEVAFNAGKDTADMGERVLAIGHVLCTVVSSGMEGTGASAGMPLVASLVPCWI